MAQEPLAQSTFLYFNPEQTTENRNNGHYTPHPQAMQMDYFQYSRPQSAGPQMMYQQPPQYISQALLTPVESPKPIQHKPTILVQQEVAPFQMRLNTNYNFMPATPTLSATSTFNSLDSPQHCQLVPSSVDMDYFGPSTFQGVKKGCEDEVFSEVLTSEWTSANSPPMTPGMQIDSGIVH